MSTKTVEGFSISHAAILNGATGAEEANGDIYGVKEGSIEIDLDSFDNTGDDAVLSTWNWFNYANVSISSGYVPLDTIALLTGDTVASTGVSPADSFDLPLWSMGSLNQPSRPMLLRIPSKDSDGAIRVLDIVLYKVQFAPISIDGPSYKDGLMLNYSGKALISDKDEEGNALVGNARSIGRLISHPVA